MVRLSSDFSCTDSLSADVPLHKGFLGLLRGMIAGATLALGLMKSAPPCVVNDFVGLDPGVSVMQVPPFVPRMWSGYAPYPDLCRWEPTPRCCAAFTGYGDGDGQSP